MTDLDDQLRDLYGPLARHSEYRCGDQVCYRIGSETYEGTILWVMEPGPSMIEGRGPQPLRYVVERHNWEAIPDVVWSSDIDA
jgi:hypothetical protein